MAIEPNAKKVPSVVWEYWGWIHTDLPAGMYGIDQKRSECHDRICQYYKLDKEITRQVTDNIDRYENAVQLHEALKDLQNFV